MTTKADPYATKLHKRVDALLLIFTILLIVLVFRTSARGEPVISFAPQPFWTTLSMFQIQPRLSLVVDARGSINQSFGGDATAQRLELSRLAGSFRNSSSSAVPMEMLPERAQANSTATGDVQSAGYRARTTSQPSLADNWSRGAGVGSTIPAYSTGFGTTSSSLSSAGHGGAGTLTSNASNNDRSVNRLQNSSTGASALLGEGASVGDFWPAPTPSESNGSKLSEAACSRTRVLRGRTRRKQGARKEMTGKAMTAALTTPDCDYGDSQLINLHDWQLT